MRLLKQLPVCAFWIVIFSALSTQAQMKSFREWKAEQIQQSQQKVSSLQGQIVLAKSQKAIRALANSSKKTEAGLLADPQINSLEKDLQREEVTFELTQNLSVADYFSNYLSKAQDRKSAFKEVAAKLTPEEVAELMTAYANSVIGAATTEPGLNNFPSAAELNR